MFPFKFPYTNFHELNLDWILETTKSNTDRIAANELKIKLIGGDDPLNALHPVGSIYISTDSASPASLFGGEWEQISGRFLIGTGSPENNDDNTSPGIYDYAAGSKGGEKTHTLTNSEAPRLDRTIAINGDKMYTLGAVSGEQYQGTSIVSTVSSTSKFNYPILLSEYGKDQPHNNMPPYLAVYMWKRVN